MTTTVSVMFQWVEYRPDNRQFKQQSILTLPTTGRNSLPVIVVIEVPAKPEYIINATDIIKAPLEGNPEPPAIFTPSGIRYLVDEWEKCFHDVEPSDFESKPTVEDAGWGTEETSQKSVKTDDWGEPEPELYGTGETKTEWEATTEDDNSDWEEAKPKTEDAPWDETTEDWGENK